MTEFLVDNIYVRFGESLFRQKFGISVGTNCAPLLADLFFYSYEREILDRLIKDGERKLLESSAFPIVTWMTLSLLTIKDLRC